MGEQFDVVVVGALLDPILADAAQQADAEMMMSTTAVGLERAGARVAGVRVRTRV